MAFLFGAGLALVLIIQGDENVRTLVYRTKLFLRRAPPVVFEKCWILPLVEASQFHIRAVRSLAVKKR